MSMVNVLLGLYKPEASSFAKNFRFDAEGTRVRTDFVVQAYDPAYLSVNLSAGSMWKIDRVGADDIIIISMLMVDTLGANGKLQVLNYLESRFPNKFRVVGVWKWDGLQLGLTEDSEGVVTGTPTYPIHARVLKSMPDDVVYDAAGNEVSRTEATEFKQVNLYLGQAARRI